MVEAFDLLRQTSRNRKPFKLGAETGAGLMLGVMVERARGRGLCMFNHLATIRNVLLERIQCRFDQVPLARFVFFLIQFGPVAPVRVRAAHDGKPLFARWPSLRVVEAECS